MKQGIYQSLLDKKSKGQKSFAVLIDPDKVDESLIEELVMLSMEAKVDYLFIGGSLVISNQLDEVVKQVKNSCEIPTILSRAVQARFLLMLMHCSTFRSFPGGTRSCLSVST